MDLKNVEYADIPLSAYLYAVLSANPKILDQMEVSQMGRITLAQVFTLTLASSQKARREM
jgi:hypothetical protein